MAELKGQRRRVKKGNTLQVSSTLRVRITLKEGDTFIVGGDVYQRMAVVTVQSGDDEGYQGAAFKYEINDHTEEVKEEKRI